MSKTSLSLIRPTVQSQSLNAAVEAFMQDAQARNLTPKSITYYSQQLGAFAEYCATQGCTALPGLTADLLRSYIIGMQQRRLKGTSQHTAMRAVRAFLNWCVREGLLAASPMMRVTMPRQERDILPALSVTDVATLLEACQSSRDKAIILCLLDSGMRATEFCGLNVADYDKRTGSVVVRHGKGRKQRVTFFGPRARAELARYLFSRGRVVGEDPLFVSDKRGTRLTVSGLDSFFDRLGQRSGIHATPHALRRTCATFCHRSGWSLEAIRRLLGHSDFSVLRRYLDLDTGDIADAHRSAPPSGLL